MNWIYVWFGINGVKFVVEVVFVFVDYVNVCYELIWWVFLLV